MIYSQEGASTLMIAPSGMTNSATQTANLDRHDPETGLGNYATIRVALASEINTNAIGPTLSVLESDDTEVTNFATIVADRTTEDITTAKIVEYHIDCRSRKRYLRASVTTGATTNDDITLSVVGTLSRNVIAPTNTAAIADAVVIV